MKIDGGPRIVGLGAVVSANQLVSIGYYAWQVSTLLKKSRVNMRESQGCWSAKIWGYYKTLPDNLRLVLQPYFSPLFSTIDPLTGKRGLLIDIAVMKGDHLGLIIQPCGYIGYVKFINDTLRRTEDDLIFFNEQYTIPITRIIADPVADQCIRHRGFITRHQYQWTPYDHQPKVTTDRCVLGFQDGYSFTIFKNTSTTCGSN